MRKWTRTAGLLFMAAASVYSDGVALAAPAGTAKATKGSTPVNATEVTALEDVTPPVETTTTTTDKKTEGEADAKPQAAAVEADPFAAPSTQPAETADAGEGQPL